MPSKDQQTWIVFNGEIYNYLELRAELSRLDHEFRTGTDTEVILTAYEEWGTECFKRFNGMWGMAIIDLRRRTLILSRDRLGVKPLYVWSKGGRLAFASEIKQFFALPHITAAANMDAVVEYIDTGYEFPPATFFKDIQVFPAGCWGEVPIDRPAYPRPQAFWFPEKLAASHPSRAAAQERTRDLFADAVKLRLRSDVPVGVCLSGGLDSSAIFGQTQILKSGQDSPAQAFSAAFDDARFDERQYVQKVLEGFGGEAHYTFPTAQRFLQDFDSLVFHHDEPPGSLSQYAAWSVMRLAREHNVPVLLNGQGGDELFSGYWSAYYLFLRQICARSPHRVAEHLLGALLPGGNPDLVSQLLPHLRQYQVRKKRFNRSVLLPCWQAQGFTLKDNWACAAQKLEPRTYRLHEVRQIHLPRLLKWEDRNSMAFSIEGRYPFLDYRIVEWVLTVPPEMNLRQGWNKLLIREALSHALPPAIQWRRSKVGFVTPQSEWIRTGLRSTLLNWAAHPSARLERMVDKSRLKQLADELLNSRSIHRKDERQFLLIRLFFLDRWLSIFKVEV
jgi:asparagine synthase (glutamine-hydrolysing)